MSVMNYPGPWRSRFVYGVGGDVTDWALRLPSRAWDRRTPTIGGSRTAASGTPAAHVVRRDYVLGLMLRLWEAEWQSFERFMVWAQADESFLWYPDARVNSQSFLVYLETPKVATDIVASRDPNYPKVLETKIELRTIIAAPWNLEFFPACT